MVDVVKSAILKKLIEQLLIENRPLDKMRGSGHILDEATANIDSHTEVLIQKALKSLLQGRTAIVIAHRLSTIRGSDKIVVVQDGQIAEQGNHDELMNKGGLYSHLYNMNFATMEAPQGST